MIYFDLLIFRPAWWWFHPVSDLEVFLGVVVFSLVLKLLVSTTDFLFLALGGGCARTRWWFCAFLSVVAFSLDFGLPVFSDGVLEIRRCLWWFRCGGGGDTTYQNCSYFYFF
jgi:hypothetical protein